MVAAPLDGQYRTLSQAEERVARLLAAQDVPVVEVARRARMARSTLYLWLDDPAFRHRIRTLREEFRDQAMQDAAFADKRMRVVARNGIAVDMLKQLQASDYKTVVGLTDEGEPIEGFDKERLRLLDTYLNSIAEEMGDRGTGRGQSISVNVGVAVALDAEERVGRLASLLARLDVTGD
jgi:hypothetical protein